MKYVKDSKLICFQVRRLFNVSKVFGGCNRISRNNVYFIWTKSLILGKYYYCEAFNIFFYTRLTLQFPSGEISLHIKIPPKMFPSQRQSGTTDLLTDLSRAPVTQNYFYLSIYKIL